MQDPKQSPDPEKALRIDNTGGTYGISKPESKA